MVDLQNYEDPARIDRLRPEFTHNASVGSIDVQIKRARKQQNLWERRLQSLIALREAREAQVQRGEWPVVSDEARAWREAQAAQSDVSDPATKK